MNRIVSSLEYLTLTPIFVKIPMLRVDRSSDAARFDASMLRSMLRSMPRFDTAFDPITAHEISNSHSYFRESFDATSRSSDAARFDASMLRSMLRFDPITDISISMFRPR